MDPWDIKRLYYPEVAFGGFSRNSGGLEFYARIAALLGPQDRVLDFGAGRGSHHSSEPRSFVEQLVCFKGRVGHVAGCDIDPVVLENPGLDSAAVIDPCAPLPYPDASFDLVHACWVLEHVDDPAHVADELIRVLKPGGYFCAITPNLFGYIAAMSRLVGNRRHARALRLIQPHRPEAEIYPTRYRMNRKRLLKRLFAPAGDLVVYARSNDPAYYFSSRIVFRLQQFLHWLLPEGLQTTLYIFFRKADPASGMYAP